MDKQSIEYFEQQTKIKACHKIRKVKTCLNCCRCEECWGKAPKNFPNVEIDKLLGAMIWQGLEDLEVEIPPLKECKTKSQKQRRQKLMYQKASAQNFFNSEMFRSTNLDLGYLRRAYAKAKIHESRY